MTIINNLTQQNSLPEIKKASWNQTEQMNRIKGIALVVFGLITLVAGFATIFVAPIPALVIMPFSLTAGTVMCMLGAIKINDSSKNYHLKEPQISYSSSHSQVDPYYPSRSYSAETMTKAIRGKTLEDILNITRTKKEYDQPHCYEIKVPIILDFKDLLKDEMNQQLQENGVQGFYEHNKNGFDRLFRLKIMPPELFTDFFKTLYQGKPIKEIPEWLFSFKILNLQDYTTQLEDEVRRLTPEKMMEALRKA